MKPSKAGTILLSIAAVSLLAVALVPSAGARGRTTVIVRNGAYGMLPDSTGQLAGFKVRNRHLRDFRAIMTISCRTLDTGETNLNTFLIRDRHSFDIGRNGRGGDSWEEEDGGRDATIRADVTFTSPTRATVTIIVIHTSRHEECTGSGDYNVRRGPGTTGI